MLITPMPKHSSQDPNDSKLPRIPSSVNDPTPKAVSGGGSIGGQDYTKFIQWSPLKIAIATLLFFGPYAALLVFIWMKMGTMAGLLVLILALIPALGVALMYWLSKAVL
jgi:hypothetical protein